MINFTNINKILVRKTHLIEAFNFLKYAGTKKVEGMALFAGYDKGTTFHIEELIIPKQTSYILEQGLMYAVDSEELHKLNIWLYQNDMKLIAQIHSHPQEAYHSTTDDRYPIVDTYGGISIVVPNFATGIIDLADWAVFRLSLKKSWDILNSKEVNNLFEVY